MNKKYFEKESSIINSFKEVKSVLSENTFHGIDKILKDMTDCLLAAMFPFQYGDPVLHEHEESKRRHELYAGYTLLKQALEFVDKDPDSVEKTAMDMLDRIPENDECILCPPFEITVKMEDEQRIERMVIKLDKQEA